MFKKNINDRISEWAKHRQQIDRSDTPLEDVWEFWQKAPFIPYNKNIDPYNKKSWPTPWDIIVENKYDDFTKSLMIALTLKYTNKFKNTPIEIPRSVNDDRRLLARMASKAIRKLSLSICLMRVFLFLLIT